MLSSDPLATFLAGLSPSQRDRFLYEAMQERAKQQARAAQPDYTTPDGIVAFTRDILHAEPAPYQERILRNLAQFRRECAKSPHGSGKTCLAAWAVLWGLYAFDTDVKILTTASVWRQCEKYLWPEIKRWLYRARPDPMPRVLHTELILPNKHAFAVVSDNPYLIEGAHSETLIYIFDESKSIPSDTFDAAEGALSTGNTYALMLSTPGEPSGRFYEVCSRKAGYTDWHVDSISLAEAIAAGRIDPTWAENRKLQWGEGSAVYQNRVLGEFADSGEDSVIPLSWVERAIERWHEVQGHGDGDLTIGCDPARYGEDKTCIASLRGRVCEKLTYYAKQDTMETAGRVILAAGNKSTPMVCDVGGLGAGVYDRLRELGYNVTAVNSSERSDDTDRSGELHFLNMRSALWWKVREALDPTGDDPLALPPDDALVGDLCSPRWSVNSSGKIVIESKDDIRKRLGRSTDSADALALAVYLAAGPGYYRGSLEFLVIPW